jgi:hypothetical protein
MENMDILLPGDHADAGNSFFCLLSSVRALSSGTIVVVPLSFIVVISHAVSLQHLWLHHNNTLQGRCCS